MSFKLFPIFVFEGRILVLIVAVSGHCFSFTLIIRTTMQLLNDSNLQNKCIKFEVIIKSKSSPYLFSRCYCSFTYAGNFKTLASKSLAEQAG